MSRICDERCSKPTIFFAFLSKIALFKLYSPVYTVSYISGSICRLRNKIVKKNFVNKNEIINEALKFLTYLQL